MKTLQTELAWSKNLPREMIKEKSFVNLLRILLRCSRLYKAKMAAEAILKLVLNIRDQLRFDLINDDSKVRDIYKSIYKSCKRLVGLLNDFREG